MGSIFFRKAECELFMKAKQEKVSDVLIIWPRYSGTQENFTLAPGLLIQSAGDSM